MKDLYSIICRHCRRQRGYFLAELQMSVVLTALLGIISVTAVTRCLNTWEYLIEEMRLQEASRHIFSSLERSLGYNAMSLTLYSTPKISYQTIYGNKKISLYVEKNGFYQKTTTGSGTGTNPLFLEDVKVTQWQVKKISSRELWVTFTLTGSSRTKSYSQLIYCYNTEVTDG